MDDTLRCVNTHLSVDGWYTECVPVHISQMMDDTLRCVRVSTHLSDEWCIGVCLCTHQIVDDTLRCACTHLSDDEWYSEHVPMHICQMMSDAMRCASAHLSVCLERWWTSTWSSAASMAQWTVWIPEPSSSDPKSPPRQRYLITSTYRRVSKIEVSNYCPKSRGRESSELLVSQSVFCSSPLCSWSCSQFLGGFPWES